jgi:methylated-DNA-[protein]-cysteine S-methyltransferase
MSCILHPRLVAQALVDTPLGPMRLAATAAGLAGAWFEGQAHHPGQLDLPEDASQPWIAAARRGLSARWQGAPESASAVALDLHGTPFQRRVWAALLAIPAGTTRTYADVAAAAGSPGGSRAAGAAIGRNPVSVFVPCHRVVGRDGSLTGYAGGLARKEALLQREGARGPGAAGDAWRRTPGQIRHGLPHRAPA